MARRGRREHLSLRGTLGVKNAKGEWKSIPFWTWTTAIRTIDSIRLFLMGMDMRGVYQWNADWCCAHAQRNKRHPYF